MSDNDPKMSQMLHEERIGAAVLIALFLAVGCAWYFAYVKPTDEALLTQAECAAVVQVDNPRATAEEAWDECAAPR